MGSTTRSKVSTATPDAGAVPHLFYREGDGASIDRLIAECAIEASAGPDRPDR
jgi:hypothetical protein